MYSQNNPAVFKKNQMRNELQGMCTRLRGVNLAKFKFWTLSPWSTAAETYFGMFRKGYPILRKRLRFFLSEQLGVEATRGWA
jgi:hypothetical protein